MARIVQTLSVFSRSDGGLLKIAHRGYILVNGKIMVEGPIEKVSQSKVLEKAFFGEILNPSSPTDLVFRMTSKEKRFQGGFFCHSEYAMILDIDKNTSPIVLWLDVA